jgi:hypothetical protein
MSFLRLVLLCAFVSAMLFAAGCSHQPRRVDCDGHLEPINPVTPVVNLKCSNGSGREP